MYSGSDDPRRWVLPQVLAEQASVRGAQPCVSMVGGETLTYRELDDQAAKVAGMLAQAGAIPGDRVMMMMRNGLDFVRVWTGIVRMGAIAVPLNTDLTGNFLAHPLTDCDPRLLVIDAAYLPTLQQLEGHPAPDRIIVTGAGQSVAAPMIDFERWRDAPASDLPLPAASDIACIMYTSGTTGAPKGVLMPHGHCFLFGLGVIDNLGVMAQDRYYICLPLFHANGLLMQLGAVFVAGAHATVRERFSASSWLGDIQASRATITHTLGAMSAFVVAQPPSVRDKIHDLRLIFCAPNHPDHEQVWRDRFGIADVIGGYGMTEVNIPLYGERGVQRPGACGRVYDRHFEVELRDPDTDFPVAPGDVGEIMVRPRIANAFMAGYHNIPAKTVEAWRNFWFHTGDAARMDEDGYIVFVDRIKDCIRRRGENISPVDIEASIAQLPGVAEVAAFAVPSDIDGGEDEIMLAVVQRPGEIVRPVDVVAHARRNMPRFAQPRFLEFVQSLPKTGTEKVRKIDLRDTGVTDATIDLAELVPKFES